MRHWWILFFTAASLQAAPLTVPLETMSATNQRLVRAVLAHCTLHRQPAPRQFAGRIEDFTFLLDNLGACAALAYQCGLANYRPVSLPSGRLVATNQQESVGWLELIDCRPNSRVYYLEGAQSGSFTARGQAVVVVSYRQTGPNQLEYTGELFVRLDNALAAILTRMFIAFVRRAVDRSFDDVICLPAGLTQLALEQPALLRAVIQQLPAEDYERLLPLDQRLAAPGGRANNF